MGKTLKELYGGYLADFAKVSKAAAIMFFHNPILIMLNTSKNFMMPS